jgi:glycosyltransferase involved in cell wall biosynthesis
MNLNSGPPLTSRMNLADTSLARDIVVVGPFPPPIHGFSQATSDVAALLEERGFRVTRIELQPILHTRGFLATLGTRLSQFTELLSKVRRGSPVYVALSGGLRQGVDLVFLTVGRLGGVDLYVHHHSFAYLDCPTLLANICILVSGRSATHLVLCDGMKIALQRQYRRACNVAIVSNAGLRSVSLDFNRRTGVRKIGYLGALTKEKGILEFLETAEILGHQHSNLRFSIAGPCNDATLQQRVSAACHTHPSIDYVGPVYNNEKNAFIRSLDVLLFPTSYHNEAEPLVIWEAMSSGVPVIGWDRGCIGEMLAAREPKWATIPRESKFVTTAVAIIESWLAEPELFSLRSAEARAQFEHVSAQSHLSFERILPGNVSKAVT